MEGWRAYYSNNRTFDSATHDWTALPRVGCLGVVVFEEEPKRRLVYGGDWYYLNDDGEPTMTRTHEQWGEWIDEPDAPTEEVKRAGIVGDTVFEAVRREMNEDMEWP